MNVIKRRTLQAFWEKHSGTETALKLWFKLGRKARWRNFEEAKATFGSADAVKVKSGATATVFDVGGNKVRIVTLIDYARQVVLVTHVLTHPEYDRDKWKDQL